MPQNDRILKGPVRLPEDGQQPDSLIILCHGYGANGDDLIALSSQWRPLVPGAAFIAPNAPERLPGTPNGYQWFPLSTLSREERLTGTLTAAPMLDAFIDSKLDEYQIAADRLVLVGFSQGTMMSLHVGLRRAEPIAGIIGYSGALTAPERLIDEIKSRPPVLLVHGDRDAVVPFPAMYEAVGALEAAGLQVEKHLSPGVAHGIGPDGIRLGGEFLKQVLA